MMIATLLMTACNQRESNTQTAVVSVSSDPFFSSLSFIPNIFKYSKTLQIYGICRASDFLRYGRNMNLLTYSTTIQFIKKSNYVAGYDLAKNIFCLFWLLVDRLLSACNLGSKLQLFFEITK
jgi:hypothetical protein